MKIDLTRREYRDLLDMLYIAEWIINAHREKEDSRKYKDASFLRWLDSR